MSMPKRSPPAMPPAVFTSTASSARAAGPGKRTRTEPCSATRLRRVTPAFAATVSARRPSARLAAKTVSADAAAGDTRPLGFADAPRLRLERHGAPQRSLVQAGAVARIGDAAAVHDHEMIAELVGKVEILLDQHDRHLAEPAQVRDGAAVVLDDRRLDALGRLVEQQEARPHHQGAADRELLLLPAGEIAAAPAQHVAEHRKEREHVVGNAALL